MRLNLRDVPHGHTSHRFSEPAADLGLGSWFEAAGPVEVIVDAERRGNQVTLRGTARVVAMGRCGRCTRDVERDLEAELLLVSDLRGSDAPEDEAALEQEGAIHYHDGVELVVDDPVREAIILEVPVVMLCREECKGLCAQCGHDLNEGPCSCATDSVDPRWEAFKDLNREDR